MPIRSFFFHNHRNDVLFFSSSRKKPSPRLWCRLLSSGNHRDLWFLEENCHKHEFVDKKAADICYLWVIVRQINVFRRFLNKRKNKSCKTARYFAPFIFRFKPFWLHYVCKVALLLFQYQKCLKKNQGESKIWATFDPSLQKTLKTMVHLTLYYAREHSK